MTTAWNALPGWLRSVLAVLAGLVAIIGLSMAADEVAYALGLFPRPPKITYATVPYVVATVYRGVIGVAGAWLAARLAPGRAIGHAIAIGIIGVILSTMGLTASLGYDLGPVWYPAALLVITMPCALAGGYLARRGRT